MRRKLHHFTTNNLKIIIAEGYETKDGYDFSDAEPIFVQESNDNENCDEEVGHPPHIGNVPTTSIVWPLERSQLIG